MQLKLNNTTAECRKEWWATMTAAKPAKGIARKPMRMQLRDRKKFKPNNKYNRRKLEKSMKKAFTK